MSEVFVFETETDDKHVNNIRNLIDRYCSRMDNSGLRVYTGDGIESIWIQTQSELKTIGRIVDIDCEGIENIHIMQKGGKTHSINYNNIKNIYVYTITNGVYSLK